MSAHTDENLSEVLPSQMDWITKIEYGLIALLTFSFLGLSIGEMFHYSIKSYVFSQFSFLIALLGGLAATKNGRHLGIHLLPFIRSHFVRRIIAIVNGLFLFFILLLLCYASIGSAKSNVNFEIMSSAGRNTFTFSYVQETLFPIIYIISIACIFSLMAIRATSWSFSTLELGMKEQKTKLWQKLLFAFLTFASTLTIALTIYAGIFSDYSAQDILLKLHLSSSTKMGVCISWLHQLLFKIIHHIDSFFLHLIRPSALSTPSSHCLQFIYQYKPFILIALCFVFLLLGTPVFVFLAAVSLIFAIYNDTPIQSIANDFSLLGKNQQVPILLPLILLGYVIIYGKGAERIMKLWHSTLGWIPASEAIATIVVCAFMSSLTGGSGATIIIMGGFFYQRLTQQGYSPSFAAGLVTTAGGLGLLIPPSAPILLYHFLSPMAALPAPEEIFKGGSLPALVMIALVIAYAIFHGVKRKVATSPFHLKESLKALWNTKWDLFLPISSIFLFKNGITTLTQTAAFAAVFAIIIEVVIHKTLHPIKQLPKVIFEATIMIGAVFLVFGMSKAMESSLVELQLSERLSHWIETAHPQNWVFLLGLNGMLLLIGGTIEMYGAMTIFTISIAQLASKLTPPIHPVHMAVIFFSNMEVGFILPPIGLNLILASLRLKRPITTIYKDVLPFLAVLFFGLLFITYYEPATIWIFKIFPVSH